MDHPSFVSKARTAFHSAAAKAERVFTDFKSDRDSENLSPAENFEGELKGNNEEKHLHLRWRPANIGTKQDWQDKFRNIRIGKKGVEESERVENSTMAIPFYDENLYILNQKNDIEAKGTDVISMIESLNAIDINSIPSPSVLKQLAVAVEVGKRFKSMKDFLASSGSSSPVRERTGLTLSAVKSLVLRDKEDKVSLEFNNNEKVMSLIHSLFDAEGNFLRRKTGCDSEALTTMSTLPRDIHGAPPESLVVKLSEVIGSFKTLRRMALFWGKVVAELGRLWSEEQYVPGIPVDKIPDLNSCLLYQQLQVINCCLSRKRRRAIAAESLDSVMRQSNPDVEGSALSMGTCPASPVLYVKISTGELVLRLGADHPTILTMLETGEPIYSPITQDGPLLTEDLIKETEELVLRTGSVGAGCSQLLSDMQAFKAANPGCILEDFVRWHSPPDWTESEQSDEAKESSDGGDALYLKGQLSTRMQKEGNLWRELWETSKPVPAVKQVPLFDEDLAVEGILNFLEEIPPCELFEQLFISLLGSGFVLAEARLSTSDSLSKYFYECKDYVFATCQGSAWTEKVDDICQVYETVETMLSHPEEILMNQVDETTTPTAADEPKSRFKRLRLNFRQQKKQPQKGLKIREGSPKPFYSFFDGKSSLFSKKPPKPDATPSPAEKPDTAKPDSASTPAEKPYPDENDWTIV
ncbi:hypothetical protein QYF36_021256 [Acer negundo]|nr:hypothetical protein QYF36_021256 [Acer negundo]